MDYCVIAAFRLYCIRRAFIKCITAIDNEEGTGQKFIKKFRKGFTTVDGIKTIRDA
jgi:hypothetical protein